MELGGATGRGLQLQQQVLEVDRVDVGRAVRPADRRCRSRYGRRRRSGPLSVTVISVWPLTRLPSGCGCGRWPAGWYLGERLRSPSAITGSSGSCSDQRCPGPAARAIADGVDHQLGQIGELDLDVPPRVEAGEHQYVLDQSGHPDRLGLDPAHRRGGASRQVVTSAAGQCGVPADRH